MIVENYHVSNVKATRVGYNTSILKIEKLKELLNRYNARLDNFREYGACDCCDANRYYEEIADLENRIDFLEDLIDCV